MTDVTLALAEALKRREVGLPLHRRSKDDVSDPFLREAYEIVRTHSRQRRSIY